ncbi:MAG: GatB/YqeY domain-containing protein [Deltaproteobacteria bacterium]|nr:GatB/YqeY domain-containing protein [Deltaproteobacteria bacterium]
MALDQKLQEDLATAMKAKDTEKVWVLRMVIADLKNLRVTKGAGSTLTDDETLAAIASGVKKRKDSIEQFEKGNRADLADKEKSAITILETYLPTQIDAAELEAAVDTVIAELGATSKKDMGKVMKAVMERIKGRADGKAVSSLVSSKLP